MDEVRLGMNKFCGPAVLSIMTGHDSDECAYRISCVNGQHNVTGVHLSHLMAAGEKMGLKFQQMQYFENRSLFFTASVLCKMNGMYVVVVANHYVMLEVKDGVIEICDNHTKTPMDLKNSARLSQKVHQVVKVDNSNVIPPRVKPTVVSMSYSVTRSNYNYIKIIRHSKMSDDTVKPEEIASVPVYENKDLQEIAFALMELTKND